MFQKSKDRGTVFLTMKKCKWPRTGKYAVTTALYLCSHTCSQTMFGGSVRQITRILSIHAVVAARRAFDHRHVGLCLRV